MGQGGVHRLLLETAERFPDRNVLITPEGATRYAELHRLSGRIAASLVALGLRPGERVVLAVSGALEHLAVYYGILKAGGVVVPHPPDTRSAILAHCISHSEAWAVVLDGEKLPLLDERWSELATLREVVTIGQAPATRSWRPPIMDFASLLASPDEIHDRGAAGQDLAILAYTSGTTGEPKGVMLSHGNLVANTRSIVGYLGLGPDEIMAMLLPFHYAYGASVVHTHVATGGALAMVGSLAFPAAVLEAIQDFRCTGLAGVPSTFAHLVRLNPSRFDLSALRYLTQAGGAMSPALTRRVQVAFPRARLFVMYGQTEATARLSYLPPDRLEQKLGSVGIPVPGVTLEIVDEAGRPVAPGQTGEVVARGANVMLGYWKDPEGTARALRPEGLRTGDLGFFDADGYLHLVARQSEIIKSGGYRISPRQIEEVIEGVPGVAECGVVGVPDELLGEAIAAVVVASPGSAVDPATVRRRALALLPRHQVPLLVRFVRALPRTASGKLRRAELRSLVVAPADVPAADEEEASRVAPAALPAPPSRS